MVQILEAVEVFVKNLFEEKLSPKNLYHNLEHTENVAEKVRRLSEMEDISDEDRLVLQLAALFHDTGYIESDVNHEIESQKIAAQFLQSKNFPENKIGLVQQLIAITKLDSQPSTILEMIIKDADCGHLADENYAEINENLKKEKIYKSGIDIDELEWQKGNLSFFKNHRFYTASAREKWQPIKEINQFELEKKIQKLELKLENKENPNKKYGRGVETLFRVQLKNHIELSAIADTKANILLSVNAIIISVLLSTLMPKLDSLSNNFLVIPTFILIIFSVITVVLSVLSTRPNISNVQVTREMIKNKQTNILFFGNFYKMKLDDFEWGIDYLIENEDVLYNSLSKDLYYLGLVLERKYRILRITYTVFMFGIVISALAFIISYFTTATIA